MSIDIIGEKNQAILEYLITTTVFLVSEKNKIKQKKSTLKFEQLKNHFLAMFVVLESIEHSIDDSQSGNRNWIWSQKLCSSDNNSYLLTFHDKDSVTRGGEFWINGRKYSYNYHLSGKTFT